MAGVNRYIFICADAVIWNQAPVFQSQSVLHFSYQSKLIKGWLNWLSGKLRDINKG
jgi:hypothetical protein